ncbi:Alpha-mannosidase [Termitomyces sp. J132]|nr:Alpha-mannosidase [Termitomyces sp. J132]
MSYKHPHHRAPAPEYPELNYTAGDKWIKSLTKDRIGKFHGGRYSDINLSSVLFTHRIDNSEHVKLQVLQNKALVAANEIMNVFNRGDPRGIREARKIAEGLFGEGWEGKRERIYDEGVGEAQVWGIGICHIDTAWLWPYRVTQQKVARSWSTQVDLMDRYPEHRFTCSSAQQYKWLEQLYPPLFQKITTKVHSGQFQPVGGSWVENDGNMPSGEALIRQFVFGQKYFESRFGKRCETAWLPDSFGLTGALPQLIRGAGMKYFFTQKLSWPRNVFPHTTFNWVGIDGTQVLCHMTPVDTYTAQATVGDVNKGQNNHKNLESSQGALLVFGNGDGGGGPLAKMLENLRRIRAVANTHRELPTVSMGRSVDEFFVKLERASNAGKTLPNWWVNVLSLIGRGTLTRLWSIKKGNRHSEILLRDVEHVATLASLYRLYNKDYVYPKQAIDDSWEKVLLNQCIGMVYDDAEKLYAEVHKDGEALLDDAFRVLFPDSVVLNASTNLKALPPIGKIIGFNTTFFRRSDIIEVPLSTSLMVYVVFTNGTDNFVLRNSSVQLTISKGRITSLLDVKLGRELISQGSTGGLVIFEDQPNYWDAWDVEIHHLETVKQLEFTNVSVVAQGPLRGSVKAVTKYDKSTIEVTISLDAITATVKENSRSLLHFDAVVDWHQRHEFLKFELPLNIHSVNATYETQFGHVQRPTHKNTTWDIAKFEVCGHKYADLSEFGYGVAILSESKYGFSCIGNILRISLLRSATAPDAEQDQGEHKFSWGVMPHEGHFLESDVPMAAYLYNSPLRMRYLSQDGDATMTHFYSPFTVEGARNVFLETLKRGENDSFLNNSGATTIVLRLYEAFGGHAKVMVRIGGHLSIAKAYLTNLLEDHDDELNISPGEDSTTSGIIRLDFRGFEVKTVKLVLKSTPVLVEQLEYVVL